MLFSLLEIPAEVQEYIRFRILNNKNFAFRRFICSIIYKISLHYFDGDMFMQVGQKAVLITGAGSGIGNACAYCLANRGYWVFAGVKNIKGAEIGKLSATRGIVPIVLDVTDLSSITAAREKMLEFLDGKGLSGLINNAGISFPGPLECTDENAIKNLIDVNLTGLIMVTREFLPLIRKQRGRIINMGSPAGRIGIPCLATYSATKSALRGLTRAPRLELRSQGIEITLVEPGNVSTPIWDKCLIDYKKVILDLSEEKADLYKAPISALLKSLQSAKNRSVPANFIAEKILTILNAKKLKPYYAIGMEAKCMFLFTQIVPVRQFEYILAKILQSTNAQ
jgi:short-subunit dehydrogenase